MQVLRGLGLEESGVYVHPYFSQLFLASIFWIIGYPTSLHPIANNIDSIETLYMVPRVLMGILAVLDTFLIYKIALSLYKRAEVAFIASMLFAVMPITFSTRWVLLEPIQLPFILSSIFLAVYTKRPSVMQNIHKNTNVPRILISGIFLGLAIFTKIPAFTMIPVVGYLIFTAGNAVDNNNNKRGKIQNQNQNKDDYNDNNNISNIAIRTITKKQQGW
jgi:dolichyl-phosphate-mannose--protein O-mannosyl transferase